MWQNWVTCVIYHDFTHSWSCFSLDLCFGKNIVANIIFPALKILFLNLQHNWLHISLETRLKPTQKNTQNICRRAAF